MKKLIAVFAVLLCIFALAACKKTPDTDNPNDTETVRIDKPVYEGSNLSESPFVGTFVNTYSADYRSSASAVYEDLETPSISISADGSFVLVSCLIEARSSVELRGTLSVDGECATLTFESRSKDGFLGENVETAQLILINTDEMKWRGESVSSISDGDIFTRNASEA